MRYLVLTNDYEIFGNGAGSVHEHVLAPTERMAAICENHGVRMTIFFEVEEYLAFQRFDSQLKADLGYSPAEKIRAQLMDLARRGHDIQLHIHPEWHNAFYEAGRWTLCADRPTVDSLFESAEEVEEFIASRKAVIDEIREDAGLTTRVRIYRAGAFSAQPGQRLLSALEANNICIDTSVCKGLTRKNVFDYRAAPSFKGPWRVSCDVAVEDHDGGIWEFPIFAVSGRRWQQATFDRLRAKFSRRVPGEQRRGMVHQLGIRKTPVGMLRFLFEATPIKLDYHNVAPRKLLQMIDSAPKSPANMPDVLVLIGHSKEHRDDRPLDRFLGLVGARPDLKVITFNQVADLLAQVPASSVDS